MIFLDTTVLVYAIGDEHPLRAGCRRVLQAHAQGSVGAATTVEVLQEFAHVRARRRTRQDAVERTLQLARSLTLVASSADDLDRGLQLWVSHRNLGSFDAVLAATAMRHDAEALVSADRAFRGIRALNHLEPNAPGLARLLRSV